MDAARLRRASDIALARARGSTHNDRMFSLWARPNGLLVARVAVSAPRTIGGAVVRNRARRRLREAVRAELRPLAGQGRDLLVVARREALGADAAALRAAVAGSLRAALS